jgi:hypothetical protein
MNQEYIRYRQYTPDGFMYWGYGIYATAWERFAGPLKDYDSEPYIGLQDHRNIRMYVGDIVQADLQGDEDTMVTGPVKFDMGQYVIMTEDGVGHSTAQLRRDGWTLMILGNIHEGSAA